MAPNHKVRRATKAAPPASSPARRTASPAGARDRVLRAAAHSFVAHGYAQTTVRDIARTVGILSGSLFHHFDSKEELLEAVMTEVSARNTERMQAAALAEAGTLERVRALLRLELDAIHGETGEAMTLLVTEWRSLGPAAQARVLVLRDAYESVWLSALQAAADRLAPMDPFILRRLLQGMTAGSAHWYRPRGTLSLDALTDRIMTLIAPGAATGHAKLAPRGRRARA